MYPVIWPGVPKFGLNAEGVLQFGAIRSRVNKDGRDKVLGHWDKGLS